MNESAPHEPNPEVNMFELVDYNGVSVPRYLLEDDRASDLEEYTRGWNAQKQRMGTKLVYGSADNYYDLGAVKNWITAGNHTEYESETIGVMDLDLKMKAMRANPRRIPREAWSDEDFGSDRRMDNGGNQGAGPRYYSPEILTPSDISPKNNSKDEESNSDSQNTTQI